MFADIVTGSIDTIRDIIDNANGFLTHKVTGLVLIIVLLYFIKRFGMIIIGRAVRNSIKKDNYASTQDELKREDTILSILDAVFKVGIWVFGTMLVLGQLGVAIAPMLAGVSFVGIAIGFGAQSLVKDFVSGIFIIMENQYRVGDVVEVAGVSGTVEKITMRETVLRNLDGDQHHIPNGSINVATNKTMDFSRVNMDIGVGYDTDMDHAQQVIDKVGSDLAAEPEWAVKIIDAPKFKRVSSFGASEVTLKILGKVQPGAQWSVAGEFRRRIKLAFDENDIEIPFPQRVVHTIKDVPAKKKKVKKS